MKWMEAIRRHWLLFMIAAFFIPLIVIRFFFSDMVGEVISFDAKWDAADMVSYCISYMSMVGTLFLGFATHRQGHLLNETEKRMEQHTHLRSLSERQPSVLLLNGKTTDTKEIPVHEVPLAKVEYDEKALDLKDFLEEEPEEGFPIRLTLVNSARTFLELRYLVLTTFEDEHYEKPMEHFGNEDFYVSLAPGEKIGISLLIAEAYRKQFMESYYRLSFELYNSIGERYVEQVHFASTSITSKRKQGPDDKGAIDTVAFGYQYHAYNYDDKSYEEL